MMKCEICHLLLQRNKRTKHDKSKQHKYYSNLILNTYFVKDVKLDEFEEVFSTYYFNHTKKFDSFTVRVYWKVINDIQYKIFVPQVVSFGTVVHSMTVNIKETACDFLDRAKKDYLTGVEIEKRDKNEIGFISDLKNITFNHYMDLPEPMIRRKMIRKFFEVKSGDIINFEYNWILRCFYELLLSFYDFKK